MRTIIEDQLRKDGHVKPLSLVFSDEGKVAVEEIGGIEAWSMVTSGISLTRNRNVVGRRRRLWAVLVGLPLLAAAGGVGGPPRSAGRDRPHRSNRPFELGSDGRGAGTFVLSSLLLR
jgi:hypothetical protein